MKEFCFNFNASKLIKQLQLNEKNVLANIALRLPANSEQLVHEKMDDVFVITQKAVYSFRLPDRLLKKTPLKLALRATYNATFISSGKYVIFYVFFNCLSEAFLFVH